MTCTEKKRQRSPYQPVGRWIRADKRLAIYLRDRFTCLICGTDMHGYDPRELSLDHVIPRSQGGSNMQDNVYTCCLSCNSARADRSLASVAVPAARKRIKLHCARKLDRFLALARACIAGETSVERYLGKEV